MGHQLGALGQAQVLEQAAQGARARARPLRRALEIGAGTGYFSLNLVRAGVIGEAVATDISPGMLTSSSAPPTELGLTVETVACEAEKLPFEDDAFDLVFGHAVLHHLPDLDGAFREFPACCARRADRLLRRAVALRRPARRAPQARRHTPWPRCGGTLMRRRPAAPNVNGNGGWREEDTLERWWTCTRSRPRTSPARARRRLRGGARSGEELAASLFGWANRTLEASADPVESRGPGACTPTAATCCSRRSTAHCSSPPARGALLQPAAIRAGPERLDHGASSAGFSLKNPSGRSEKPTVSLVMTGYCSTATLCVWPTVYQTTRSRSSPARRWSTS